MPRRVAHSFLVSLFVLSTLSRSVLAQELPYPQRQPFKDAVSYLDEIENLLLNIEDRTSKAKPGDASIQEGKVKSWNEWKADADKKMGYVDNRMKTLPMSNPKVKEQAERYAKYKAALEEQGKKLDAINKGLSSVLAQGEGEGFKADFERLKEINKTFYDTQVINTRPQRAIDIIKQMEPAKAERARLVEKYADLLKQDSSRDLRSVIAYFDDVYPKFEKMTQDFAAGAPAAIDKDIADATEMARGAVAEKKHLFFRDTGGVAQRLGWAQIKLDVFTAINESAAAPSKQKLATARADIAKMRESLNDDIIASNELPPDQYRGPDRDALIKLVKEQWAKSGVDAQVLKAGINSTDWQRDTQWVWQSTSRSWYKVDASKAQGHVIVKLDDKTAVVHYVNLYKDHLKTDAISTSFFDDPKTPAEVNHKLAIGKVK